MTKSISIFLKKEMKIKSKKEKNYLSVYEYK